MSTHFPARYNLSRRQPRVLLHWNVYSFNQRLHRAGAGVAQSVLCLTTDRTTGLLRFDPLQRQEIFPLTSVSRPALGPTQPPVQWIRGVFSPGLKRVRSVMLITHRI
jgi:hypothetical protein